MLRILSIIFGLFVLSNCRGSAFSGKAGSNQSIVTDDSDKNNDDQKSSSEQKNNDADNAHPSKEGSAEQMREACGTSQEKTTIISLNFPSTKGVQCKWGQDGNLTKPKNTTTIARAVFGQSQTFTLGEHKAICNIAFEGGSTRVWYDDFIIITMDDFILASGQFTEAELKNMNMEVVNGLIKYDRLKHIGKGPYNGTLNNRSSAICPQDGSCSIPISDTPGQLFIRTTKAWFDRLPSDTLNRSQHELTVWITGQGDDDDCQHNGLSFNLKISYVE